MSGKNGKISRERLGERDELMMNRLKSNKGGGVEEKGEWESCEKKGGGVD